MRDVFFPGYFTEQEIYDAAEEIRQIEMENLEAYVESQEV